MVYTTIMISIASNPSKHRSSSSATFLQGHWVRKSDYENHPGQSRPKYRFMSQDPACGMKAEAICHKYLQNRGALRDDVQFVLIQMHGLHNPNFGRICILIGTYMFVY